MTEQEQHFTLADAHCGPNLLSVVDERGQGLGMIAQRWDQSWDAFVDCIVVGNARQKDYAGALVYRARRQLDRGERA